MNKLGFWQVFALVTGSQIGTGILMLPASLAPFGFYSFGGWALSGCGAIFLALVFARLCAKFPRTGGPHAYVQIAFGNKAAFITAWTYWLVSWASTAAVIIGCIGYLTPIIGDHGPFIRFILQIVLLFVIVLFNLRGVAVAGSLEVLLSSLKLIPLVVLPFCALFFFSSKNIQNLTTDLAPTEMLLRTTLLTLWGFIGVELATTPAGSVQDPHKTIPRAVVAGTIFVALLYIFNCLGIQGAIPTETLAASQAPYADAVSVIFSPLWTKVISLIASIICIGTLNAWVLSSSQVALGAAQDGFFPSFMQKQNKNGAAQWSIIGSSIGLMPILFLTANDNVATQLLNVIDISVVAFVFVYLACCFALLSIARRSEKKKWTDWALPIGGGLFCLFVISATPFENLLIAAILPLSGCLRFFWTKNNK